MEKFITHLKTFIHQYHHKIIGYLCLALFFAYAYLIRHTLQVADNTGNIKIVAVPEKNEKSLGFEQSLRNITIDGQILNWEDNVYGTKEWGIYTPSQKFPLFTANAKENKQIIEIKNPTGEAFNISFEVAHYNLAGFFRIYVDDKLIAEQDNFSPDLQYIKQNFRLPQHLGVNKRNIVWWIQLAIFAVTLLVFHSRRLYNKINLKKLRKVLFTLTITLATIYGAFKIYAHEYLQLFNSVYTFTKVACTLILLTLLILVLESVLQDLIQTKWRFIPQLVHLSLISVTPFLIFYILEYPYSQIELIAPSSANINIIIITIIWLSLSLLFTSIRFSSTFTVVAALVFSIINTALLEIRQTPLLSYHLLQSKEALSVSGKIAVTFSSATLQVIILAFAFILAVAFLPSIRLLYSKEISWVTTVKVSQKVPQLKKQINRRLSLALVGLMTTFFLLPPIIFGAVKQIPIELDTWKMQNTYRQHGFVVSFIRFYLAAKVTTPNGYGAGKVEDILKKYPKKETDSNKKPNIIIIQNEALADYSQLTSLDFQPDPLKNIHELSENTIKGTIYTSTIGGGTAQTEYEVLTSNTLALFPPNVFPFQQSVTYPTQSIARSLDSQGYVSITTHPYGQKNYRREQVYPYLGFTKSYFSDSTPLITTLYENEILRTFTTDAALYKGTQKLLSETSEPLFNFVVTMQGHGLYETPEKDNPRTVKITNAENNLSATDYLSSLKLSDQAFKDLIEQLKSSDEPTVVVMYGDHQPTLATSYFDTFLDKNDKGSHYKTPLIIWANFLLPKRESPNISPNYIVPYLYDLLSETDYALPVPSYYQFMNQVQKEIPIMTAWGYYDKNGQYSEKAPTDSKLFKELQYVQHNRAFDKKAEELKSSYE